MIPYELSEFCKQCIKNHKAKKGTFNVKCKGIPRTLMDEEEPYFPTEQYLGIDKYNALTEDEKIIIQKEKNKLLWAKTHLGWSTFNKERNFDQWYQKAMLCCTAPQKVFRCGRRLGKTETICVDVINYMDHNPGKNVMIIGPFQNLIDEIFDRLDKMLGSDSSVYKGKYSRKRKPNEIKFDKGGQVRGYTTGNTGDSIRGQSAHRIYLDEAAYLPQEAFKAILALKLESASVEIVAASTPSPLETNFKLWCMSDPTWAEFHFPSTIFPFFKQEEHLFRQGLTEEGFELEILANFCEGNSRIFKTEDVQEASYEYNYINSRAELENPQDWTITIGTDWNEFKHGVQITVLGFNKKAPNKPFKILKRVSIHNGEGIRNNVQVKGVRTIIELYNAFSANFVYVDRGHGSMQSEELAEYFFKIGKPEVFKAVDFSSTYPYEDIFTGEIVNKRMKVMMVYFLQKRFEFKEIMISKTEESDQNLLIDQLNNYFVEKYDNREQPIFSSGNKPDHILDSLMLAMFAFIENNSVYFEKNFSVLISTIRTKGTDFTILDSVVTKGVEEIKNKEEKEKPSHNIFDKVREQHDKTYVSTSFGGGHAGIIKKNKKIKGGRNFDLF